MLISVSTWYLESRFGTEKMFSMMKEAGIDAADYGLDDWVGSIATVKKSRNYQMTEEETVNYYTEIKRLADRAGIVIGQTHSMFGAKRIFDERDEILKVMKNNILATHVLVSHYTFIHPVATEGRIFDEQKEECFAYNLEFYRSLIPILEKYDVKIGIEPMWTTDAEDHISPTVCSRPEEILEFIKALDSDRFCSCPDLGHFQLTGYATGDTPAGALRKLGSTVEIIHAHEVIKDKDCHTAPCIHGTMDWEDIGAALREIGYAGTLNFEIGGNYYKAFPDCMIPEALRHVAEMGKIIMQPKEC